MNIEPLADDVPLNGPKAPNVDQIDDLIRVLVTIRHRFGNTAVSVKSLKWGSSALWEESTAAKSKPWQPMTTAPKDGTEVLLKVERRAGIPHKLLVGHYMPGGHCIEDHPAIADGWYFWNGSMFDKAAKPLEWMPLPE
jgi:hypothetical protein